MIVKCVVCGTHLDICKISRDGEGNTTIEVGYCETCAEAEHIEAMRDGHC